jgi:hypothetical protein
LTGKRRLGVLGLIVAGAVVVAALFSSPASTQVRTITEAILQGRVWTYTALQSFRGGARSISATVDGAHDLTLTTPTLPPNGMVTGATVASCLSSRQYRFYKAWVNESGISTYSAPSSPDFTPTTNNRVTTISFADEAPPANATAILLAYSSSNDSHATKRWCGTAGISTPGVQSSIVAPGVTTFDCRCQGSNTTNGTSGIISRVKVGYQGELRAGQESIHIDKTSTIDKNRLLLSGTTPQWSNDSGSTYGRISTQGVRVRTVCASGCDYPTLTAALAGITDATSTTPYVIDFDGIETTGINMKSYVSIYGKSREYSQTGPLTYGGTVTGTIVSEVTISGNIPIQASPGTAGARTVNRVEDSYCGLPLGSVDCLADGFGGDGYHDWIFSNVTFRSKWDTVILGKGSRWWDFGCRWELLSDINNTHRGWNWEQTSMIGVEVRSYGAVLSSVLQNNGDSFIGLNIDENSGTPDRGTIVEIHSPSITATVTAASWTGFATCAKIHRAVASSYQSRVNVYDMTCRLTAGASGTLTGIETTLDASDHSTWRAAFHGGEIELTGGGTRTDIINNETNAGFLSVSGMRTGGVFSGSGVIAPIQTHRGAFDTRLLFPSGDLVAATCVVGEIKADTAGATQELCWCIAGPAWACVSATTVTGPTD